MRDSVRHQILRIVARLTAPLVRGRPSPSQRKAPRILVIRPDHIGDVLFTTPALRVLRSVAPDAHIAYMVGPWACEIVKENPHLDEIIVCPFPGFTRRPKKHFLHPYVLLWSHARSLRPHRFDIALVLRFDHWWGAMLAYWAGIPERVGYGLRQMKPFLTNAVPYVVGRHEVEQSVHLVNAALVAGAPEVGGLEFSPTQTDLRTALDLLGPVESNRRFVCVHPGAGAPVKLWRPEAFAQVADMIVQRHGVHIVITGSAAERGLAESIAGRMDSEPLVLAGRTSLGALAAVMRRCELVVGVDSGPLHVAVSQGVPTVHLFGPVDHHTFGPWGDPTRHLVVLSDMECSPCNRLDYAPEDLEQHACVRSIKVEQVLRAADSLLARNSHKGL